MEILAKVVKATSQKTGKSYVCIEIHFPNGYIKRVFLNGPELYMVKDIVDNA